MEAKVDDFFFGCQDSQISCISLNIVGIMYDNETHTRYLRIKIDSKEIVHFCSHFQKK